MKTKAAKRSLYTPGAYVLRVKRSSSGLGLFAEEDIPRGVCVIEYVGRVISKEEEFSSKSLYLFEVHKNKTIDGKPKWNKAGYINHSCKPNCEVQIRGGRVFIFSKRVIPAGEELGYDYEREYFLDHIAPYGCGCGAKKHLYEKKT